MYQAIGKQCGFVYCSNDEYDDQTHQQPANGTAPQPTQPRQSNSNWIYALVGVLALLFIKS